MNNRLYKLLFVLPLSALFWLAGCQQVQKNETDRQPETPVEPNVVLGTLPDDSATEVLPDTLELPKVYDNEGISIQLTGLFRNNRPSDFDDLLSGKWLELYGIDGYGKFFLTDAKAIVSTEMDDCLGDSSTYIRSEHGIDPLFFIKGLKQPLSEVYSITPRWNKVWVGHPMSFSFNDQEYTLEGQGLVLDNEASTTEAAVDPSEMWQRVINYRLTLTTKQDGVVKKQLLIAIPSFNETFVQILFVGDLDNDGKPDFVFDISREYEEKVVILMLSSHARGGELVRCVGKSDFQFDC